VSGVGIVSKKGFWDLFGQDPRLVGHFGFFFGILGQKSPAVFGEKPKTPLGERVCGTPVRAAA